MLPLLLLLFLFFETAPILFQFHICDYACLEQNQSQIFSSWFFDFLGEGFEFLLANFVLVFLLYRLFFALWLVGFLVLLLRFIYRLILGCLLYHFRYDGL